MLKTQNILNIKMALRQWFIHFFDKKSGLLVDKYASVSGIKNVNISIRELAEELYKPITRKFKKSKVHSSFLDNIWGCWSCWHAINKQV